MQVRDLRARPARSAVRKARDLCGFLSPLLVDTLLGFPSAAAVPKM